MPTTTIVPPPGPKSFLGIRLARRLQRDVLGFSMDLARQYGDIVAFRCGPVRFFQFTHPDQIADVLVREARKFHKPRRLKRILGKWDGQGLILSDGELWVRQRRLVQQAFQPRRVQAYAADMVRAADRMLARWEGAGTLDMVAELHRVTLDIVCKTLFGVDVADHAEIRETVQTLQETAVREMGRLVPLPDWLPLAGKRRFREAIRYMKALLDEIIRKRRATREDTGDLLSMLLLSVDSEGDGAGMNDQQARDETMTLLLAGHETTATTLVWATWLLAAHPEIQERTAAAVADVLGDRLPTSDDVPRLSAVDMVIKEAMRLYPAVYFTSREAAQEVTIGGCRIPPASQVHLVPYVVYHDARWFDEPESFRPERFAPGYEDRLPQFAYFPFGGGPRVCIGKGMATMEATLILASLLQRYRLAPAPGQGPPEMEAQISLHPKGPVRLSIERRGGAGEAATRKSAIGAT
ncbi:MAG: cytochrome P450 [Planctomycetia bacterium]|nr:cytochrome P450 [Planctomycetia bacterium]